MTTTTAQRLTWTCNGCGKPVADGAGYIHVNESRVAEVKRKTKEVTDRVRTKSKCVGLEVWSGGDLLDLPNREPWRVHHSDCDPEPDSIDYHFDIRRARTHAHLLSWTAHLMRKDWIGSTDWADFIDRMAGVDA